VKALGENGLVEVIAIIGYYTLIGNTLNVFQVGLPEGETPPFQE
jgi:4-carboxymuconolactone decarboxylase